MKKGVVVDAVSSENGLRQPLLDNALILSFLSVVDHGSYTLAARAMHRTQSAISLQIRRLEETLGVQLFEQPRHQVHLSFHGEAFLDYARRMVDLNREALASVNDGTLRGIIRIGSNHFYASQILPDMLALFCSEYPEVQVQLTTGGQSALSTGLGAKFDIIFNFYLAEKHEGRVLSRESLHWIEATGVDVWSMDPLPVALLPQENLLRTIMIDRLNGLGRPWRMVYESQSVDATIAAVAAGLAVSICVGSRLEAAGPKLRAVEKADCPALPECVFTVELSPRPVARATRVFNEHLLHELRAES